MNSPDNPKKRKHESLSADFLTGGGRYYWDGTDDVTLDAWIEATRPSKLTSECWTEIILNFSVWFEQNKIAGLDQQLDEFFCAKDQEKDDSYLVLSLANTSV